MRIIVLCGGSGKRLWPLSSGIRSKIFLRLLSNAAGPYESMIERVCRQLDEAGLSSSAAIVTTEDQIEITRQHVGDHIPIIAEPCRRGTFMAVGLAASYLHAERSAGLGETICVLPADMYVEAEFYEVLRRLPDIAEKSGADLVFIGTKSSHPSSQYGYIVPAQRGGGEYEPVVKFVEKPNEAQASALIRDRAMWNCGVFAFSLSYMLDGLAARGLSVHYEELIAQYAQLPARNFDEEVAETSRNRVVVPYNRSWTDLGDWRVLAQHLEHAVIGQGDMTGDSLDTHIVNELPIPIHVIGLSNLIVAASAAGILIAPKDQSNRIKAIIRDDPE